MCGFRELVFAITVQSNELTNSNSEDVKLSVYRTVRVLIKEIIHDTISEKSEMEKQRKGYCTMKIYEKIFARLEELHMSQTELSRRTDIATSTISDWRKKQINPQADKLVSICKALDMTLVELLCDEE